MKTIKNNIENEIEIKNSKFIAKIYKTEKEEILNILEKIKKEHPKATHYCYAYNSKNYKKSSDDNEPTGTAGKPILNVLEKEELENVLVVIIRYFGGIKLGAGGLIRAYTKATTEALKKAIYQEVQDAYKVRIQFPYSEEKNINYLIQEKNILKKEFQENIIYECIIEKDKINNLSTYNYEILENTITERDS